MSGEVVDEARAKRLLEAGIPVKLEPGEGLVLSDARELRLRYRLPAKPLLSFLEGLARGALVGSKCSRCGLVAFPPVEACTACGSEAKPHELSGEATLLTYTQISAKPSSFQHYDDYIVAVGRLKEGPALVAWLEGAALSDISPGGKLRVRVKKRNPEGVLTYSFELVR